jgi:hypothetical protein
MGAIIIVAILFFALHVFVLRWMFRINRAIKLLASIDESLKTSPCVRQ